MIFSVTQKVIGICTLAISTITLANSISKQNISTKIVQLDNGMQVILISDPLSKYGAVSVTIPAGQRNSPTAFAGLPHALEHAVFLGSQKFPISGEYRKFVKSNQGWMNGSTRTDNTRYHFQVRADALESGMERLSDLLFHPLLSKEIIASAIAAVDEEFEGNKKRNWLKVLSVIRATTNPAHPSSKFGIGNKKTFESDLTLLKDSLKRFHKQYYQPQHMTLAIYGPQTTEQLALLATRYFSKPASKEEPAIIPSIALFLPHQSGALISVQTNQKAASLDVRFHVPAKHKGLNPQLYTYIRTLLENHAHGGLLDKLKNQGLVTELLGYSQGNRHFGLLDFYIGLTPLGKENIDQVLNIFFHYITFLKTTPHPPFLQSELKSLELRKNEKPITMEAGDWLSDISDKMQTHDSQNWINSYHWNKPLKQGDINSYLEYFSAEKAQIILNTNEELVSPEVTPHYQAKYTVSPNFYQFKQKTRPDSGSFSFPSKNKYLSLFYPKYIKAKETTEELIESAKCLNIYSATQSSNGTAKIFTTIELNSQTSMAETKNVALMEILSTYLEDPGSLDSDQAETAGYRSSSSVQPFGIRLDLSGDYSGFNIFLDTVLKQRLFKEPSEQEFKQLKAKAYTNYEDKISSKAYRQAFAKVKNYILKTDNNLPNILKEIESISYKQYILFRKTILSDPSFDIQFAGALSAKEFKQHFAEHINYLKSQCLLATESSQSVVSIVSDAVSLAWIEPHSSIKNRAIQSVLTDIFKEPFYHHMRTEKKLAYYVKTTFLNTNDSALIFTVQSSKSSPETLVKHTKSFIEQFNSQSSMLQKELKSAKHRILQAPFIKPLDMAKQSAWIRSINRLGYRTNEFMEEYLKQVKGLTVDDLQAYISKQLKINITTVKQ